MECKNRCGQCCKVIILRSRINLAKVRPDESKWLLKHFTKINRVSALKLNPNISLLGRHSYYICDYFDYSSLRCKGYNDRLPMCINYPFYDNVILDRESFRHTPDCYFINQVMYLHP